jgi:hypothetical protein
VAMPASAKPRAAALMIPDITVLRYPVFFL